MPYANPVIRGFHPDPSVCRVGDDYYCVNSTFSWFPGIPVHHSKDLVNWRKIGHVLDRPEQLDLRSGQPGVLTDGIYAPTIRYHEGKFYCVTTNYGHGGNIMMHAEDPAGPWSDPIPMKHGGWDNSLCFDDDGTCYYHWSSGVQQVMIDPATGEFLTEPRKISDGIGEGGCEGSHLYKIGDWYYLMAAEGGTHWGHLLSIMRSRSPWGPFEKSPYGPLLTHRHTEMTQVIKALGHGDLIQDHQGNWWVLALGFRTTGWICFASHVLGRETFLAPVSWTNDGWPVVNQGNDLELQMDVPTLPLHPWPERPARLDFDEANLPLDFIFRRTPIEGSWSLTEKPGHLTLHGRADGLSQPGIVLVGQRQEDLFCEVSAKLLFEPAAGDEAGLTTFMDEHDHSAVGVRQGGNGQREAFLKRQVGAVLTAEVASAPLGDGEVIVKIQATRRWYRYGFEQAGQTHWLSWAETHHHSTETAWGWTGVVLGLYATGNGKQATAPAHFDWFEYRAAADQHFEPDMPDRFAIIPPSDQ